MNQLRLIAGQWRGRKINFIDLDGLRPSPDRIRETLFNWTQGHIVGASCIDLFGGSGALSFEAASRGAADVTCIELNRKASLCIKHNIEVLEASQINLINSDALAFLASRAAKKQFDLVFLDPPFVEELISKSSHLLEQHQWLKPKALIYIESGQPLESIDLPGNWLFLKQKKAGQVYYGLCERQEA